MNVDANLDSDTNFSDLRQSKVVKFIGFVLAVVILCIISQKNFLLFHSFIEGYTVVIAFTIYIISSKTYRYSDNGFLFFLGNAYFFIGLLDFFHLITYKGIGIFPVYNENVPTQFWIAGRYLESISILLAPLVMKRSNILRRSFIMFGIFTAIIAGMILYTELFPVCYISGVGLSVFKIVSEYLISLILLASVFNLYRLRKNINLAKQRNITLAIVLIILSELSFTLYVDIYGIVNMVGHVLKLASYYLVYRSIITVGLETPYAHISAELHNSAMTDYLTGVYNRRGFIKFAEKEIALAERQNLSIILLVLDLDQFKELNDELGHIAGDKALKLFAETLKVSVRKNELIGRFGGDEFVILAFGDKLSGDSIIDRINHQIQTLATEKVVAKHLSASVGTAAWRPGYNLDDLIREADKDMYEQKYTKRKSVVNEMNHEQGLNC